MFLYALLSLALLLPFHNHSDSGLHLLSLKTLTPVLTKRSCKQHIYKQHLQPGQFSLTAKYRCSYFSPRGGSTPGWCW